MFLRTLAVALVVMCSLLASQTTPRPGQATPQVGQPAPDFTLPDSTGSPIKLSAYKGKVVLLDFWATWCTGCKHEIPWFAGFQSAYGAKGLAVVGVAMDDEGWKVVKPFLAETKVPYRILVGNEATSQRFGIENLPDTFLIDRHGRVAAAYKAALVDRSDIEAHIKALLSEN